MSDLKKLSVTWDTWAHDYFPPTSLSITRPCYNYLPISTMSLGALHLSEDSMCATVPGLMEMPAAWMDDENSETLNNFLSALI